MTDDSSREGTKRSSVLPAAKMKKIDSPGLGLRIPTSDAGSGTSGKIHERRYQID